jgi:hypothetical protein
MATATEFYNDPDWEGSSGPIIARTFDASEDLWPHGTGAQGEIDGGDKDVLADGLHPVLAIGPKGNRPRNLTGVVMTYQSNNDRAVMNLADKVVVRQFVSNILTYSGGAGATFDTSLAVGDPVYVDDSGPLSAGVTLSRSPLNESTSSNPLAGYVHRCQDQYDDSGVGGYSGDVFPMTLANTAVETEVCVMLVNDCGYGNATTEP